MDCAGKGAYVSKNFLQKYAAKKEKAKAKEEKAEEKKKSSFLSKKSFKDDSDSNSSGDERCRSIGAVRQNSLGRELNYSGDEMHNEEPISLNKVNLNKEDSGKVFEQEIDTNIFKISLSTLKGGEAELATGDPLFCQKCKSVFNKFSKIEELKGSDQGTVS